MTLRPYIERPQAPGESIQVEPRFARTPLERAGRLSPDNAEETVARVARLVEQQNTHSMEILRSLATIAGAILQDQSKADTKRMGEQLQVIDTRLRRVEEGMTKLLAAVCHNAQPQPRAAYSPASPVPPRVAMTSTRAESFADTSGKFRAAYRELVAEGHIEQPNEIRETIEAAAREQGIASEEPAEAFVKAAFSLLPKALSRWSATSLQSFVRQLLGATSALIRPKVGDVLDLAAHCDCSTEVTGTRGRVREVIFPGVRQGERVLVRALVQT